MSALTLFQFDGREIRVVTDENGEPLFVGKDVCDGLGYANAADAIKSHCRGVAKRYPIADALGRAQETRVLAEPDVLRLIVNCTLPAGVAFERLVFEEILPSIRKTGSYTAPSAPVAPTVKPSALVPSKEFRALYGIAKLIGLDKNAAAISANQGVTKLTGTNMLALLGQTHMEAPNQDALYFTPTELGKRIGVSGQKMNTMLSDAGMRVKCGESWDVTDSGKPFARIYDTGKKHDSGVPVQQVKWSATVIEMLRPALPAPDQSAFRGM